MNARQLQYALLSAVRERMRDPGQWVKELSAVLHKSGNAVYKKMQGTSSLSLEEIVALCNHYDVYIDPLITDHTMTFRNMSPSIDGDMAPALRHLALHLKAVSDDVDTTIWYGAVDLPLRHVFHYPALIAFSGYMANYTTAVEAPTPFAEAGEAITALCQDIHDTLGIMQSREFWSNTMFDVILGQVVYALETSLWHSPEVGVRLCSDLLSLCDEMAAALRHALHDKGQSPDCRIYHNELVAQNVSLLMTSGSQKCLYLCLGQPDALYSASEEVVGQYVRRFERLASKSEVLSAGPGRGRIALLSAYRSKILDVRARVEALIKVSS